MTPAGIIGPVGTGADVVPSPSLEQAREYIRASKAENTLRGYQSDWREFCAWCEGHGVGPLPAAPETVAAYIAECAGHLKPGSIQRRRDRRSAQGRGPRLARVGRHGQEHDEGDPAHARHGARAEIPHANG
jgi:hypothetical protein